MAQLLDLYTAHPFWAWVALGAALLALEVATGSGWLLWPAASAAATAIVAAVLRPSPAAALLVFAVLTIASTLAARRFAAARPSLEGDDINDNIARLVGQEGRAVAPFRDRAGRVFIDGKEWAAELDGADEVGADEVGAGAALTVVGVHGARLRVRAAI